MKTDTPRNHNPGNYADVNGIKMYYELHGTGNPLVLLHGGGSTINTTFNTILPVLATSNFIIAVELQAHGRTGDRPQPETFKQDADDVATLLDILNIERASIFGFSNGGQTAIEFALRHPQKTDKLIIASAFYKRDAVPDAFWQGFGGATLSSMPKIYQDEFMRLTNSHEGLLNMFNKDVQRMMNFTDWNDDDIRSITAPVLVVTGDKDLAYPEHTVAMYKLFPNAKLAILPGDHGSYMGEAMSANKVSKIPLLFAEMVNEFLTQSH